MVDAGPSTGGWVSHCIIFFMVNYRVIFYSLELHKIRRCPAPRLSDLFNSAKTGEELLGLGRKTRAPELACRGDVDDALLVRRSAGRVASNPDGGVRGAGKRRRSRLRKGDGREVKKGRQRRRHSSK